MAQSGVTAKINKTGHYGILLGLILSGYVCLQVIVIKRLPLAYDEGINIQISRFMSQGFQPYSEISTLAAPLFVWLVGGLGQVGLPVTGLKLCFLLFGALLVLITAAVSRGWFGDYVALATAFVLVTATTFTVEASAVSNIIPASAVAMIALWLSLKRGKVWLFGSGLVWGGAMLMSLSMVSFGLAAWLVIVFPKARAQAGPIAGRELLFDLAAWLAGAAASFVAGLIIFGPELNQIFTDYATIRRHLPLNQSTNFAIIGRFLTYNVWLSVLAIYAVVQFSKEENHILWLVVIWLLVGFAWLMIQLPLRAEDVAILLPPMAILAGWGLVDAGYRWKLYSRIEKGNLRLWQAGLLAATCLFVLVSWQRFQEHALQDVDTGDDLRQIEQIEALAQFIQQYTNPADCIIVDDPALAVVADRWPSPQLVGLSEIWVEGGLVDTRQLTNLLAEGNCSAIVLSRREYHEYLLQFGGWLQETYPNSEQFIRTRIFFR